MQVCENKKIDDRSAVASSGRQPFQSFPSRQVSAIERSILNA